MGDAGTTKVIVDAAGGRRSESRRSRRRGCWTRGAVRGAGPVCCLPTWQLYSCTQTYLSVANAMNRSLALAVLVLALMAFGDAGDMTAADESLSLRVARALHATLALISDRVST